MPFIVLVVFVVASVSPLAGESLWLKASNNERGMFSDSRATRVGDILTIVIAESSQMENNQNSATSKENSVNNQIRQFLFPKAVSPVGAYKGELPGSDWSGQTDYNGAATLDNDQSLSGNISVVVIDVLPNGNLVVEGVRRVTFAKETQHMTLRGLVRPQDILPDNTVYSSKIADARVEVISEGILTEGRKKGWLTRAFDVINPF